MPRISYITRNLERMSVSKSILSSQLMVSQIFLLSKMEKRVEISILGIKREFKMEKTVEISILRIKREFKIEKIVEISILRRKREFKMKKTGKISILGLRCECTLHLQ